MSELTPSFCGVPPGTGLSRWSLECAISRRPDPSATMDGRLSPTASVKPKTPGPRHSAPSKYTISPIQIEPTLSPPVEWLEDIPVPASVRKARYTVPSGSVAKRGKLFLGPAGGPTPLFAARLAESVGSGCMVKLVPCVPSRKGCVAGAPGSTRPTSSVVLYKSLPTRQTTCTVWLEYSGNPVVSKAPKSLPQRLPAVSYAIHKRFCASYASELRASKLTVVAA